MSKTIDDLRDHLFSALNGLKDKAEPMEIDRAKAISDIAQTIINTAKVEVEYMRVTGNGESRFITSPDQTEIPNIAPVRKGTTTVTKGANGERITQHRIT